MHRLRPLRKDIPHMTNPTRLRWRLAIALLALVALASCGGDDDSASNGGSSDGGQDASGSFTLITKEFYFDPDTVTASAGSTEIVIDNSGGVVEHDFTLDELGIEIYASPGETVSEVVNLDAGTYDFYCSIPGHREAGMEGTLTVS
jgi:plastocyanin